MRTFKAIKIEWKGTVHSSCGNYEILTSLEEYILLFDGDFGTKKFDPVPTLEECKLLAQAHHEDLIAFRLESIEGVEEIIKEEENDYRHTNKTEKRISWKLKYL